MAQSIQVGRPDTGIDRSALLASNDLFRHLSVDELAGLARYTRLEKFAAVHASVYDRFNQERHLYNRENFKLNRSTVLAEWRQPAA